MINEQNKLIHIKKINFEAKKSSNSDLLVYEFNNIEFNLKRFFIIKCELPETRGKHAHKIGNQIMSVIKGKIEIQFFDGIDWTSFHLSDSSPAIFVPKGIWSVQKYDENSSLLVLADFDYDEEEYIRDFDEYLKIRNG